MTDQNIPGAINSILSHMDVIAALLYRSSAFARGLESPLPYHEATSSLADR
jgi:hypothetical protein